MLQPKLPPYDLAEWRRQPFPVRVRMICEAWATQGYGTPPLVYTVYLLKIAFLYVGGWCFFVSFTPGLGAPGEIASWAFTAVAFQKAVLWTMAYEGLGLGCGSGPLTGRYLPPIGGVLYFLRPGTTKLPFIPGLPLVGGTRRTRLDVALYVAHYVFLLRALTAPAITPGLLLPTIVLLPLNALTDKSIYLISRAEHHFTVLVCFAFAGQWLAGAKVVWIAIWWWAATSKLNRHFPSVICVMLSNSPLVPVRFRKKLYKAFPDDLRPSRLAELMAHGGTAVEYLFPLVLLLSGGGVPTAMALVVMLGFHTFISSNIPMGVPLEWNVIMVYGGFFLFGHHPEVSVLTVGEAPLLAAFLFVNLFLVPLLGNLVPSRVSFLCSMRYYAGNWGYSVWLFRDDAARKLDRLVKTSPLLTDQLAKMIPDPDVIEAVMSRVPAFRSMHLHGRALHDLIPLAVGSEIDRYQWLDGEIVAGLALGWNFGDLHLHDERLLAAIQEQCRFEEGELRCIFVESQPMFGASMEWRVADAARGELARGHANVAALCERQPWPAA